MASLAQFERNMDRRAKNVVANTTRVKRTVAAAVLSNVVLATPLKSGRARYHWNVGLGAPDYSYEYDSFKNDARVGDWVGKMATSRGVIARALSTAPIYISNGLPYIGNLNRGASDQAPAGYVERSAFAGAQVARRIRILR